METINSQFTVENIERSLHQFYNDVQSQAQANQFLVLAQVSPEAWNFAWELLHPSKPSEIQFFGASTLHVKISKHWNELPESLYAPLREKLLETLFSYISGPRIILTRLCVALSSFIIQTITDFWPTAIADLTSALQPQNVPSAHPHRVFHVLLELLTVITEEFQSTHIPQGRTGIVRHALRSSSNLVMELIQNILSKTSSPIELCEMSLKCYSGWSLLGSSILEYKSILLLTFDSVYREEICQTALETLSNIANHPDSVKYPSLILEMVDHITKFDDLLERAIQDDDMDKCNSLYGFIITLAENHCHLLLDTIIDKPEKKDAIIKLINFILKCSSTPGQYPVEEICSEQAFGFWYTLQDSIVSIDRCFESLLLVFHPIFQSLLDAYLVKLRYPADDVYKQWKTEEKESFRCYRQDIGDSIMYCYNILRHAALANLMAHLSIATTTAINNPTQWQYLEACLFAIKEIAENVDTKESCYIPMLMNHLRNIPLQHVTIISATMEVIGAYAEWINVHPAVLGCIIPLLLMGLQNTEVAVASTFALKDITRDCYSSMHPFGEQILHSCMEALKGNVLKSREKVRIMCTVGKVLSVMPYQFIMKYLDTILSPIFSDLQNQLCMQKSNPNSAAVIVLDLHMLSMLFSTLDTHWEKTEEDESQTECCKIREENINYPQPLIFVLEKLLAIFKTLGDCWEVTEQITEALCDAFKRAVSTLSDKCKVFLPDVLHLLLYLYKNCPHSSILEMTKHMLVLFVNDEDQRQILISFFAQICEHTIKISMKDFRESTNVIESFAQMLEHVIKKGLVFFKTEAINPLLLFQFGLAALNLPEKPTVKATAGFLTEFITHSREVSNMLDVVNNQGGELVMQVMKVIGGDSPRAVVEYMPDILMALNKKYFDNLCRWMVPFTQQEGFPSHRVNQRQKEEFMRQILKERTNKRRLKETVTEFSLICRGLIGTEYAAQSCQPLS